MHNHCNTRVKSSAAYHPFFNTKGGASASSFMKTRVQVRALRPQIFFLMHILLFLKWWNDVFLQDHVISALYIRFFFFLAFRLISHRTCIANGAWIGNFQLFPCGFIFLLSTWWNVQKQLLFSYTHIHAYTSKRNGAFLCTSSFSSACQPWNATRDRRRVQKRGLSRQ